MFRIAAAVVKVLDKPTTVVSVPRYGRFMAATAQMLGPRGRRWLNKKLGNDRVFLDFDPPRGSTTRTVRNTRSASPTTSRAQLSASKLTVRRSPLALCRCKAGRSTIAFRNGL